MAIGFGEPASRDIRPNTRLYYTIQSVQLPFKRCVLRDVAEWIKGSGHHSFILPLKFQNAETALSFQLFDHRE